MPTASTASTMSSANAVAMLNWLVAVIKDWPSPRWAAMNSPRTTASSA